jgi:hypothetical protein
MDVSKRVVIETDKFPPSLSSAYTENSILKLISLSSYSYLTFIMSFETIVIVWLVLNRSGDY